MLSRMSAGVRETSITFSGTFILTERYLGSVGGWRKKNACAFSQAPPEEKVSAGRPQASCNEDVGSLWQVNMCKLCECWPVGQLVR